MTDNNFDLRFSVELPVWALPLFTNGDPSGITEEEEKEAMGWYNSVVEEYGPITLSVVENSYNEFSTRGDFGGAGATYEVEVWSAISEVLEIRRVGCATAGEGLGA